MPRRENTFRVDYSQFPRQLSHDEIQKFILKELGLTRENVLLLQPSRRLGCTFVEVNNLDLAERIVLQHDNKHEFVYDGKAYKLRIMMEDGAVEVRLFDLSNDITNEQITEFLSEYGDVLNIRDLLWDERSAFSGIKTGVRIVRMIVKKNIPSLVTIRGEDTSVGYKGQRQTCLHCQEFVHVGIPCVQNKKLLVQKLTADQTYANVAKQLAQTNKSTKPNKPIPKVLESRNAAVSADRADRPMNIEPHASLPHPMAPPAQPTVLHKPSTKPMPIPPPIHTPMINYPYRKADGNETDSSQASHSSGSRKLRSRRSPPGKKMRHSDETTNEHERAVVDEAHL